MVGPFEMVWSFHMARPFKQVEKSELVGSFKPVLSFKVTFKFYDQSMNKNLVYTGTECNAALA